VGLSGASLPTWHTYTRIRMCMPSLCMPSRKSGNRIAVVLNRDREQRNVAENVDPKQRDACVSAAAVWTILRKCAPSPLTEWVDFVIMHVRTAREPRQRSNAIAELGRRRSAQ
jgi:hypothetical protein